jgi:TIR domain
MAQRHQVFLSYSRHDAEIMRQVRATLEAEGLTVWSMEGIEPGTPLWDRAVEEALKAADCMVVILTPHVIDSKGVRDEIHYAQIHKVQIFPLLAAGDQKTSIPYTLSGVQFTDIRTRYASGMRRLEEAVSRAVGLRNSSDASGLVNLANNTYIPKSSTQSNTKSNPKDDQFFEWLQVIIQAIELLGVLSLSALMGVVLGFMSFTTGAWNSGCSIGVTDMCGLRSREAFILIGLVIGFSFIFKRIISWFLTNDWPAFWPHILISSSGVITVLSIGLLARFPYLDSLSVIVILLASLAILFFVTRTGLSWLRKLFYLDP